MKQPTTRLWVLLSILAALVMVVGVKRAYSVYSVPAVALPIREVGARQEVAWIIEGIAASTDSNLNGNKMSAEAIAEGASQLAIYTSVFLNHEYDAPIGHILEVTALYERIFVKIEISKTQPLLWRMIQEGSISGFSIGLLVIEDSLDWDDFFNDQIKVVDRGYIFEVSVVFIPADRNARITSWYTEPY